MVRSVLKYGSAKAKFTANVIYLQTLAVQAAQAVKVAVRKVQHHLAGVATKEAANVVVSAEAMTEEVVTRAAVKTVVVVKIVLVAVAVRTVVAVIVPVDQAEDNNNKSSRDRHRLDIKA